MLYRRDSTSAFVHTSVFQFLLPFTSPAQPKSYRLDSAVSARPGLYRTSTSPVPGHQLPAAAALLPIAQVFVGPFAGDEHPPEQVCLPPSLPFLLCKIEYPDPNLSYLAICIRMGSVLITSVIPALCLRTMFFLAKIMGVPRVLYLAGPGNNGLKHQSHLMCCLAYYLSNIINSISS
jgi:hypothetical protein